MSTCVVTIKVLTLSFGDCFYSINYLHPVGLSNTDFSNQVIMTLLHNMLQGPDNLPIEVWKSFGRTGVNFLKEALNKVTDEEKIPDIWQKRILKPSRI